MYDGAKLHIDECVGLVKAHRLHPVGAATSRALNFREPNSSLTPAGCYQHAAWPYLGDRVDWVQALVWVGLERAVSVCSHLKCARVCVCVCFVRMTDTFHSVCVCEKQ